MTENSGRATLVKETIEMAKVHIFSENVHEKHTAAITNAYAFFVGVFIVLFTFLVEKAIPLYAFLVGAVILLLGILYERVLVERAFKRELLKISGYIEQVKAGKELPALEKMISR